MSESYELYDAAIDGCGAKKVARALGLSLAHLYRLARPQLSEEHEDGTGARSDIDRIEMLVDVLAAHPRARPALVRLKLHFDSMFRRALDNEQLPPLCETRLAEKAGKLCTEFGGLMQQMRPGFDPAEIEREGAELIACVERVIRSARQ